MTQSNKWRPLLHGAEAERALHCACEIATALRSRDGFRLPSTEVDDPTLARGDAGLALFFAYLAVSGVDDQAAEDLEALMVKVRAGFDSSVQRLGLLTGLSGLAWVIQHTERLLHGVALTAELDEFDRDLVEILENRQDATDSTDVFDGLVGIGVYLLERLPSALAYRGLSAVVSHLAKASQADERGRFWVLPGRSLGPTWEPRGTDEPHVDLGMARGQAGIVAFLSRVVARLHDHSECRDLLADAARFLTACRRSVDDGFSRYAIAWIQGKSFEGAQTAWCYGDAGVCAALSAASTGTQHNEVSRVVQELIASLRLRTVEHSLVVDAGLCHGSSGLGHILNRQSLLFGDDLTALSAREWFRVTLAQQQRGRGVAGFDFTWEGGRTPQLGFVRGAAGVGLALIGASTSIEPSWDRAMLLS